MDTLSLFNPTPLQREIPLRDSFSAHPTPPSLWGQRAVAALFAFETISDLSSQPPAPILAPLCVQVGVSTCVHVSVCVWCLHVHTHTQ